MLAAWKRKAPHRADQLGKPLEAVIAFFNPDMATEWRVLDGALLVVNWDELHRRPRWYVIVPRDDGTLAAGLTASRLTEAGRRAASCIRRSTDRGDPVGATGNASGCALRRHDDPWTTPDEPAPCPRAKGARNRLSPFRLQARTGV